MEKIQMTEEQAMCLYRMAGDGHVEFIKILKQVGIIRKTATEEAEERYEQSKRDFPTPKGVRDLADEYIQELKKENVRLSNLIRYSRE